MVKGDSFCTLLLYNAQTDDNNGLQFWIEEIQMVRKEFRKHMLDEDRIWNLTNQRGDNRVKIYQTENLCCRLEKDWSRIPK